ncbi:hypothetical protein DACRYDRAFT_19126 [Dacryopinax primogenitus]|uniref:Uncharacterized protein n=1 Tax=Dacryopinax primogenitus (strain DJM 731) TaxID=1858805 RepID=M5FN53_DACPD|nr:uncharacterized protein DACRYDRAFT_19126 [Dacryopinax primogenitus]EJT96845.1 hypothetical protein DACRYDRAFT_19126 [Dacryopinax primogenitus]
MSEATSPTELDTTDGHTDGSLQPDLIFAKLQEVLAPWSAVLSTLNTDKKSKGEGSKPKDIEMSDMKGKTPAVIEEEDEGEQSTTAKSLVKLEVVAPVTPAATISQAHVPTIADAAIPDANYNELQPRFPLSKVSEKCFQQELVRLMAVGMSIRAREVFTWSMLWIACEQIGVVNAAGILAFIEGLGQMVLQMVSAPKPAVSSIAFIGLCMECLTIKKLVTPHDYTNPLSSSPHNYTNSLSSSSDNYTNPLSSSPHDCNLSPFPMLIALAQLL